MVDKVYLHESHPFLWLKGMGGWRMMRLDDAFQIKQVLQLGLARTQIYWPLLHGWGTTYSSHIN